MSARRQLEAVVLRLGPDIGRLKSRLRPLRQQMHYLRFKLTNRDSISFTCPICHYRGPFADANDPTGVRKYAKCPRCGALERHRIQFLALQRVLEGRPTRQMSLLHFAPEPFFVDLFRGKFGRYETADLEVDGVDHKVDIQKLPFRDASYDLVYASHVLEHIPDDRAAIAEIRRILKPGGFAMLAVPMVGETTVEYGAPDERDYGHVRAPGYDYFQSLKSYFARVEEHSSDSFDPQYQVYVYEDRSAWPNEMFPKRTPTQGEKHRDVVAVCFA